MVNVQQVRHCRRRGLWTAGLAVALAAGAAVPVPALAQTKGKAPSRGPAKSQAPAKSEPPPRSQSSGGGTDQQASMTYVPKAGYDPPPRSPGRLAPAQGALMGVHSADSASLPPNQQGVVKLEQAIGRTMDINNHYHGAFDDFARHGMSKLEQWDVQAGRIPLVGWGCTASDRVANGSLDGVIHA
ncbi:MAG: hypothetical protein LC792_27100, partial [Actinobacteria bacterium]|nr:hypothetical protein [Actinomycetota bacterium]